MENPFKDIPNNASYINAVLWAKAAGVTSGTTATTFSPNATCTRGQVMTFLWVSAGMPEPNSYENPFVDVKTTDYYYKPVLWAVEQHITAGTSTTTFGPNNTCTEAQILTFLWVANGAPVVTSDGTPASTIPDGTYYKKPVAWAYTKGMVAEGLNASSNCPRSNVVSYLYVNAGSPQVVNTSASLANYGKVELNQKASVATTTLLDANGIKVTATGMNYSGFFGPELKLLIENNTGVDLTFQARDVSINGIMVTDLMSVDITSGNKANTTLTFASNSLRQAEISGIANIAFYLHAFTTAGWDTYYDSPIINVYTSIANTYAQKYDSLGAVIYNKGGVKVTAKGLSDDASFFGKSLILFIENNGAHSVTLQTSNSSMMFLLARKLWML